MTTNFNIQLLGEILAQKYIRLIQGERDNIHIAPRIQSTRFPNGFVIYWKDKIKINTNTNIKNHGQSTNIFKGIPFVSSAKR
jgi:hypothetical protein